MSDVTVIQTATLSEIADAILDTTGRTEAFAVRDMPRIIREEVYGGGKSDGHVEGRKRGYAEGKNAGYSEGKTDGYSEGYDVGYAKGAENAKPTLRGSFVLKEKPNFITPDDYVSIIFPEGTAYTYFYNGIEYEYAEIEHIEFGDDDLIYIHKRGTGGVIYTVGLGNNVGDWQPYYYDEMDGFPDNDSSFRVIDIVNPVTVEQQNLYDMFMGIVENDERLPYDVGYDVGLIEGSANSTPTLIGSFVWKNLPDFTRPNENTEIQFYDGSAYAYFYDGAEPSYESIEAIEFCDDGFMYIYAYGTNRQVYLGYEGSSWFISYYGEMIVPDRPDIHRVIDIIEPVEVPKDGYDLFMECITTDILSYDIGYEDGGANADLAIRGSFMWKRSPNFTYPNEYISIYFPEGAAYTYFYGRSGYSYSEIEYIEFGDDGIIDIYASGENGNVLTEFDGEWHSVYQGEVFDFPDYKYSVIDIIHPVYIGKNIFDMFMDSFVTDERDNLYEVGHSAGLIDGKQAEYDKFWDAFQHYGERTYYPRAFLQWGDAAFYPKYDIIATSNSSAMFEGAKIKNLRQRLIDCGVTLDVSQATDLTYMFSVSNVTHAPIIDATSSRWVDAIFYNSGIVDIQKLILKSDGSQTLGDAFKWCFDLKNIVIEGTIGQNGLNFQWATKLSKESIGSVILALSTTTSGLSVTFSKTAVDKAFETSAGANDGSTSEIFMNLRLSKTNWSINLI